MSVWLGVAQHQRLSTSGLSAKQPKVSHAVKTKAIVKKNRAMKPFHQVFFEPWSVILFVSFILKTTQWHLFLNLFVCFVLFWQMNVVNDFRFAFPSPSYDGTGASVGSATVLTSPANWLGYCGFFGLGICVSAFAFGLCNGKTVFANHNHNFMQASCIVDLFYAASMFTKQSMSLDELWSICKKLSFLRYLSWSSTSQKGKKRKRKEPSRKKKAVISDRLSQRGRYFEIL